MPELAEFVADARFCDDEPATALAILPAPRSRTWRKPQGRTRLRASARARLSATRKWRTQTAARKWKTQTAARRTEGARTVTTQTAKSPRSGDASTPNGNGDANGGDAEMEDANGGEADGGEADGGETDGDEADGGEANGDEADGGEASRAGQMTADAKRGTLKSSACAIIAQLRSCARSASTRRRSSSSELLKGHPTEIAPAYNLALLRWQLGFHDAAAQGWLRFRRWPLEATPDVYETRARNLRFVGPTDEYETVVTGHVDRASSTALDRAMLRHWANRQERHDAAEALVGSSWRPWRIGEHYESQPAISR